MLSLRTALRALWAVASLLVASAAGATRPYPILFVTQVPTPSDFTAVASVFGNHQPALEATPRGGDLYVLYPNGTLRNLTQLAGYGVASGFQGPTSIAVREPAVSWDGTKAVFSMVIGAPDLDEQYEWQTYYWQLYEVTGLGPTDTPHITKVPNQPPNANNVSPAYLSDGRIVFTSDRPRNGAPHLYPQLDEYEEAPVVSGIWALDPATGKLELLDHAPSGDFKPTVDSFGRVIFTRWDHLQQDQQADDDRANPSNPPYGTFNWSGEDAASVPLNTRAEVYPEPRHAVGTVEGHTFNQFFPWMMNQDGSGLETLNHVGRHDLEGYFDRSFNDDPDLEEFLCGDGNCNRANHVPLTNFLEIRESPTAAGRYYGVSAPEFRTHAAGQVLWMPGEPSRKPDDMPVTEITHPSTASFTEEGEVPHPCHSGLYREPLPLSDGSLIVVHAGLQGPGQPNPGAPETRQDENTGTRALPGSRYSFRLRGLVADAALNCAGYQRYGATLTPGITKTLWFWDPDVRVDYVNAALWELDPVEVRPRAVPPNTAGTIPSLEVTAFANEGVDLTQLSLQLAEQDLSMIVMRNVTTRDSDDRQQPFNLTVPGGVTTTATDTPVPPAKLYSVSHLQLLQGDQIRGLGGTADPRPGRRVLAQPAHDAAAHNPPPVAGAPATSVPIAADGSVVALVPSHRAMTWQLTSATGTPVVRERYWLTMQPGEVRVCTSCHGLSSTDQAGNGTPGYPAPTPPGAIHRFVQWWTTERNEIFRTGLERGLAVWSAMTN